MQYAYTIITSNSSNEKMRAILLFVLILFNLGCAERIPDTLHYQYSPDSALIIYNYRFNSSYAFTDEISGFKLAKSEQKFSTRLPELRTNYISQWTNNNHIIAVKTTTEGIKNSEPITAEQKINGFIVDLHNYSLTRSTSCEYKFDSISYLKDSIQFHGIHKVYGDAKYDRNTFRTGPIKIESNKDGSIIEIQINTLVPWQDHMQHLTYRLKPKKQMNISQINSYGIFKELKSW